MQDQPLRLNRVEIFGGLHNDVGAILARLQGLVNSSMKMQCNFSVLESRFHYAAAFRGGKDCAPCTGAKFLNFCETANPKKANRVTYLCGGL